MADELRLGGLGDPAEEQAESSLRLGGLGAQDTLQTGPTTPIPLDASPQTGPTVPIPDLFF